jgi:hypothetical protein
VNKTLIAVVVAGALSAGCAGLTDTQQRTLGGSAIGAASGAAIGAISGDAGWGALIGAGVGAAGGYAYDRNQKAKENAYREGYEARRSSR